MPKTSKQTSSPKGLKTWIFRGFRLLIAVGFIGVSGLGISALHMRASAELPVAANPPVAVNVQKARFEDSYVVTDRFIGRIEPVRQAQLALERPGLVAEVLFDEGDSVKKGEVIARLDTAKLEAERRRLEAQRVELEARRDLAAATLKRQQVLTKKGWKSEQRLDEATYRHAEAVAAIARVDAATASIDVDLAKSVLKAPFAGTVAMRFADEGAILAAGAPVLEILEASKPVVRTGVSADAARALLPGKDYNLTSGRHEFTGRLVSQRPDLQSGTRTVTALFHLDATAPIAFGETVELVLQRQIESRGTWLPLEALSEGRKGLWSVLVIKQSDAGQEVVREAVEVLHAEADRVFVRGTLQDGADVVVNGRNRVTPGQQVAVAQAE